MRLFLIRYKTIVMALILLTISVCSMSQKIDSNRVYFRSSLFGIVFGVESSILKIRTSVVDVFINNKNIKELETQLASTEEQLLYYKELSRLYIHLQQENTHLRQMLEMRDLLQYSAYYSKVLFRDPSLLADFLIIDKGAKDGLRINMPVVSSISNTDRLILVGKTVEVGHDFARVQVVTAKNFYVGVKSLETGYTGMLRGQGSWNQNLSLEYIPVEANPVIGERIVTSGESEIYPEGLYVGVVEGIGQNVMEEFFKVLYVQSEFKYSRVAEVFVLDYVADYPDLEDIGVVNEGL